MTGTTEFDERTTNDERWIMGDKARSTKGAMDTIMILDLVFVVGDSEDPSKPKFSKRVAFGVWRLLPMMNNDS